MDKTACLRCGGKMSPIGTEKIQLGQAGLVMGVLNNIFAGSMEVEIHVCSECSKIEFYANSANTYSDALPQNKCPRCGKEHDFDYPKCPFCGYLYRSLT